MVLKTYEEKERDPPGQRESELYKECQHQQHLISHLLHQIFIWILSEQKQVPNFERRRSKTKSSFFSFSDNK
jgi:hypothetical protein